MAITDLRRRVLVAHLANRPHGVDLGALLASDPLTVIRCLRLLYCPVMAPDHDVLTIDGLVQTLGRSVVRRAFEVPLVASQGTHPVRRLWLHSLATAEASRSLAESTGLLDPDEAYLLGMLTDLPEWLAYLDLSGDQNEDWQAWVTEWHVPDTIREAILACWESNVHDEELNCQKPASRIDLFRAAYLLAELADYWSPGRDKVENRERLLTLVTKEDFVAAQNLRQQVAHSVGRCGLVASRQTPESPEVPSLESLALFPSKSQGSLAEIVASLLKCSTSSDYRAIMTATTAASVRYLDFERVFLVQWSKEASRCWIRAKSDLSLRPLTPVCVDPTPEEVEQLTRALTDEKAIKATRSTRSGAGGLLATLGVEQGLIVPVNVRFETHSFLVLDRTLTGRSIQLDQDAAHAEALAGTAAILNENLLFRNRSRRFQLFALTDPLTRLYNRTVGISTLDRELARCRRQATPLTILLMDLDQFKNLNDTLGHLRGDQALRITAEVLRKTLRKTDTACRYGGEEFLVVLPDTTIEQASVLATRLFTALEDAGKAEELPLTASIGLTKVNPDEDTVNGVLHRADQALYASKSRGRNRFSVDSAP